MGWEVFREFDRRVLTTFERIAQLPQDLDNSRSLQIALPISLGGIGLRRTAQVSPAAYWSAVHSCAMSLKPIIDAAQARWGAGAHGQALQFPLHMRLQQVHQHLVQQGVRPTAGIFPEAAAGSFDFYGNRGAPERLQAALFKQTEAELANATYNLVGPFGKARLAAMRLPHAGTWLRVCPTNAVNRLATCNSLSASS